jgi:hypothetical protein
MNIVGYIISSGEGEALTMDIGRRRFWRGSKNVTVFATYREAYFALRRFRRWLKRCPSFGGCPAEYIYRDWKRARIRRLIPGHTEL